MIISVKFTKIKDSSVIKRSDKSNMDKSLLDFISLLEAVPYGFVLIDKLGFVEACNTVGRSMFQYRNIDIIGFQS